MGSSGRSRAAHAERAASVLSGLREPIVVILFLIAFFTVISGKPLDGLLLLSAAAGLAWDAGKRTGERARGAGDGHMGGQARPAAGAAAPRAPLGRAGRTRWPARVIAAGVVAGVLYAAVVGSFTRYSWPATAAVVLVGAAVVAIGWRGPLRGASPGGGPRTPGRPGSGKSALSGAVVWGSLLVAGGLWELAALLQQPSLTTDSYAHPTISTLTDPLLGSHAGRAVALAIWLGLGWYLVER